MSVGGSYVNAVYGGTDGDIVLENGNMRATFAIPEHLTGEWQMFRVPLEKEGWALSESATSLEDVLANVTSFQIRAEYGRGPDKSAIRGVQVQ